MRQTNLYEFLGDLASAVEQEFHKQSSTVPDEPIDHASIRTDTQKQLIERNFLRALNADDVDSAYKWHTILKDYDNG